MERESRKLERKQEVREKVRRGRDKMNETEQKETRRKSENEE